MVLVAVIHYIASGAHGLGSLDLLFAFVLAAILLRLHPIAHGYVDNDGVHFREYLKLRFVPWTEVNDVQWNKWSLSRVVIRMARSHMLSSSIEFYENPSVRDAVREVSGKQQPESVIWMRSHIARESQTS